MPNGSKGGKCVAISNRDQVLYYERETLDEEHVVHWLEEHHSYEREHVQNMAAARLRCQLHRQWRTSIENYRCRVYFNQCGGKKSSVAITISLFGNMINIHKYSKVRKRQSSAAPALDAESSNSRHSDAVHSVDGSGATSLSHGLDHGSTVQLTKEVSSVFL